MTQGIQQDLWGMLAGMELATGSGPLILALGRANLGDGLAEGIVLEGQHIALDLLPLGQVAQCEQVFDEGRAHGLALGAEQCD